VDVSPLERASGKFPVSHEHRICPEHSAAAGFPDGILDPGLKFKAMYDSLHDEPRFKALVKRAGLEQ
jgi:hypothetical protein